MHDAYKLGAHMDVGHNEYSPVSLFALCQRFPIRKFGVSLVKFFGEALCFINFWFYIKARDAHDVV
jgi:hypothetical protein